MTTRYQYLYETHLHTTAASACATCSPKEQVRAYKKRGYTGIIVTDHFVNGNTNCPQNLPWDKKMRRFAKGFQAAQAEGARCGLDVFFGWEYNLSGTEFLTYGLDLNFLLNHPGMDQLTVAEYSALVRDNGGYLAQAHPFRRDVWIDNPSPVDAALMDGIEVFNASMPEKVNAKAYEFARLHHLPMQAGSDCHHRENAFTSGIRLENKAESIFDIINAIKNRQVALITPFDY